MYDPLSLDPVRADSFFSAAADLLVTATGGLQLSGDAPNSFLPPVGNLLVPKRGTMTLVRGAHVGALAINGIATTSSGNTTATVIIGRRYPVTPTTTKVLFPAVGSDCTPAQITTAVSVTCNNSNPPAGLTLTVLSASSIQLAWTDNSPSTVGFQVQRSTVPGPTYQWVPRIDVAAGVTTFTDTGLSGSTPYWYKVGAVTSPGAAPTTFTEVRNATTSDVCAGQAEGTICAGNECNGSICQAGVCTPRILMVGAPCAAANPCETGGACGTSSFPIVGEFKCLTTPVTCSDNNGCTLDVCAPSTGVCTNPPDPAADPATCSPTTIPPGFDTPPAPETPLAAEPSHGIEFNGALAGKLSVGPSGAALYTIPISIPPGIAGMAPNLSLVYNSQGGNGIAGQGMELSGLSMIHRCPKNRVQDGATQPVLLARQQRHPANHDAICIDGQRLIETNARGVYTTEVADFSTITDVGNADANGVPNHLGFRVVTKSGEIRNYGVRANARVQLNSTINVCPPEETPCTGGAVIWMLDRVEDPAGNYFEVHYNNGIGNFEEDGGDPDFVNSGIKVTSITYTGNSRAQTAAFNEVTFGYEPRQDVRNIRIGSLSLPRKDRLTTISTLAGVARRAEWRASDPGGWRAAIGMAGRGARGLAGRQGRDRRVTVVMAARHLGRQGVSRRGRR